MDHLNYYTYLSLGCFLSSQVINYFSNALHSVGTPGQSLAMCFSKLLLFSSSSMQVHVACSTEHALNKQHHIECRGIKNFEFHFISSYPESYNSHKKQNTTSVHYEHNNYVLSSSSIFIFLFFYSSPMSSTSKIRVALGGIVALSQEKHKIQHCYSNMKCYNYILTC